MSKDVQHDEVQESVSEYEQIGARMKKRDEYLTRQLRRLHIVARILSLIVGISSVGFMAFTLHKYYATINVTADGQNLWNPPDQTQLWPTYLTMVTSAIISVMELAVLMAYYWSTEAADRMDDWRSKLVWLIVPLKIAIEIATGSIMITTGVNSSANGPQSLWYQTCTMTPDQIILFQFTINLPQYCTMQRWGGISMILNIFLDVLSAVSFVYWFLHWRHKKRMKKHFSNPPEQVDQH